MRIGKDLIINSAQVVYARHDPGDDTTYITMTAIVSEDHTVLDSQPAYCPASEVLAVTDPHGEIFDELACQLGLLSPLKPINPACPACQTGTGVGPEHLETCVEYCPF
jgi:hypothetical protein